MRLLFWRGWWCKVGNRGERRYSEEHYEDFIRAVKEARDWMMRCPEANSRHALALCFAAMADTFEIDNPEFDRIAAARACGFPMGEER